MNKKQLGILALLVSALCWGPGPIVSKLALTEIPQFSLGFLRGVVATVLVILLFYRQGYLRMDRKDLPLFILAGLFGSVFNLGFFFYGIQFTSTMSAQAVFTTAPLLNTVFSFLILKEWIKLVQVGGVLLGMAGAIVIALRTFFETGSLETGNIIGNAFVFLAAISWVGFIIISKKLSKKGYHPITITSHTLIISMFGFLPLAVLENMQDSAWTQTVGGLGLLGIVYSSVVAGVLAFLAYQTGLKLTSAFTAGVVIYLQPLITTVVASVVLNERISLSFAVGALLIITGSFIATQHEFIKHQLKKLKR